MRAVLEGRRGRRGLAVALVLLISVIVVYAITDRASSREDVVEFVVDTTSDDPANAADRSCADSEGSVCALRAAIEKSNQDGLANRISFDLPNGEDVIELSQVAPLTIEDDVEGRDLIIEGPGGLEIVGDGYSAVFEIAGSEPDEEPEVFISGLGVSGGASTAGAGITNDYGTLTLRDVAIHDNEAETSGGGLLNNQGVVAIENGEISNNSTQVSGGGIANAGGEITLRNTSVTGNEAGITGGGASNYRDGSLLVYDSTVTENAASAEDSSGGGVYNEASLSISDSEVSDNRSGYSGGGITNAGGGASLNQTSLSNNSSRLGGGVETSGSFRIEGSTLANNSAGRGGGLYTSASLGAGGQTNALRSTIFGNENSGIFNARGQTSLWSSTVSGNQSGVQTSGDPFTRTTFERSIVAGNDGPDVERVFGEESGSLVSEGYNLVGDVAGAEAFDTDTDRSDLTTIEAFGADSPSLEENGGPTRTVALSEGSLAIDAIPESDECGTSYIQTDQRAAEHLKSGDGGGLCDIGAYEFDSKPAELSVTLGGPEEASLDQDLTYTISVENAPDAGVAGEVRLEMVFEPRITLYNETYADECEGFTCRVREFFSGEENKTRVQPSNLDSPYLEGDRCSDFTGIECVALDLGPGEERNFEITLVPLEDSPPGSFSIKATASTQNDSASPESPSVHTELR